MDKLIDLFKGVNTNNISDPTNIMFFQNINADSTHLRTIMQYMNLDYQYSKDNRIYTISHISFYYTLGKLKLGYYHSAEYQDFHDVVINPGVLMYYLIIALNNGESFHYT